MSWSACPLSPAQGCASCEYRLTSERHLSRVGNSWPFTVTRKRGGKKKKNNSMLDFLLRSLQTSAWPESGLESGHLSRHSLAWQPWRPPTCLLLRCRSRRTPLTRAKLQRPCPNGAALDRGLTKLSAPWFAKQTSALYYLPWQVRDQIDDL